MNLGKNTDANAEKEYCKEKGIDLKVSRQLRGAEFEIARDKAFRDACIVWNALDKTGKRRIKVPERPLIVEMTPAITDKAMSYSDEESLFS